MTPSVARNTLQTMEIAQKKERECDSRKREREMRGEREGEREEVTVKRTALGEKSKLIKMNGKNEKRGDHLSVYVLYQRALWSV